VVAADVAPDPVYAAQSGDSNTSPTPVSPEEAQVTHPFDHVDPLIRVEFPLMARISEPRGKVVLQAGPSMLSKNMATVLDGTPVLAKSRDGKWVQIYTPAGIGYVQQKELAFAP
jgi:hypothetical protein